MKNALLTVNTGSSSLKLASSMTPLACAKQRLSVERIGSSGTRLVVIGPGGTTEHRFEAKDHAGAIEQAFHHLPEIVAAASWLRQNAPDLRVRVVNVVDLTALFPPGVHPHGMSESQFLALFTADKPVIFAFHGYQRALHAIVHGRPRADRRFHVRGFNEQGQRLHRIRWSCSMRLAAIIWRKRRSREKTDRI